MKYKTFLKLQGATRKPRVLVQPKSSVSVAKPADRVDVMRSVSRVMSEHREVLVALKAR